MTLRAGEAVMENESMDNRQLLLLPGLQSVYSPSLLPANSATHNKKQKGRFQNDDPELCI